MHVWFFDGKGWNKSPITDVVSSKLIERYTKQGYNCIVSEFKPNHKPELIKYETKKFVGNKNTSNVTKTR